MGQRRRVQLGGGTTARSTGGTLEAEGRGNELVLLGHF